MPQGFTVRRMMVVIALAAVALALVARRERLRRRASLQEARAGALHDPTPLSGTGPPGTVVVRRPGLPGVYRLTEEGRREMEAANACQRDAFRLDGAIAGAALLTVAAGVGPVVSAVNRRRHGRPAPG